MAKTCNKRAQVVKYIIELEEKKHSIFKVTVHDVLQRFYDNEDVTISPSTIIPTLTAIKLYVQQLGEVDE